MTFYNQPIASIFRFFSSLILKVHFHLETNSKLKLVIYKYIDRHKNERIRKYLA